MTKSKGVGRGNHLKPERKALLQSCVLDGWSLLDMRRTHGFGPDTVKYHYPDYTGMTLSEAGKLGRLMERADAAIMKNHGQLNQKREPCPRVDK